MATKTDINHRSIDARELPGATRVISSAAWYNNFRYWCCCGVEIVADANQSDASGLYLYAHVFDWIDSRHSGSVSSFYPYVKYNGTNYDSSHMSLYTSNHQIYSAGGSNKIFVDSTSGNPWEYYFPLGKVSTGSTTTAGAQTGWMPVSGGAWSGAEGRTDGTVGSPVSASYTIQNVTVSYNGNGGDGSVSSQTRVIGWTGSGFGITVAANAFSRTNYEFVKWNTSADGTGTDYLPGAEYTGDSNVTLYAIWNRLTSTIEYNANKPADASGTVSVPATQTKNPGVAITLSSTVPNGSVLQPPYNFLSWNTSANGTGTSYAPGASYTKDVNVTLYAQWKSDYTKSLYNAAPSVQRVDSHGNTDVTGEYLKISGVVRIYPVKGQWTTTPSSLTATWVRTSDQVVAGTHTFSSSDFTDVTPSDITGYKLYSFSWTSSSAVLSSGEAYGVTLDFIDSYMARYSIAAIRYTTTIAVAYVTFSTNGRGRSAAFGQQALPASALTGTDATDGRLDVYMNTYFHGTTNITPDIATTSAPGIVQPDGTSITVDTNGVISSVGLTREFDSGGATKESVLAGTDGTTWHYGWREEKWSDGTLTKWLWQLFTSSGGFNSCNIGFSNTGTQFISRPEVFASVGPILNNSYAEVTGWWVQGGISSFTNNSSVTVGAQCGGSGKVFIEVRMDGFWK